MPDASGSPPHMRGKELLCCIVFARDGITPAHAGKSDLGSVGKHLHGDHPRTCGEKPAPSKEEIVNEGSPPHMRGKAMLEASYSTKERITPAHAGKSVSLRHAQSLK